MSVEAMWLVSREVRRHAGCNPSVLGERTGPEQSCQPVLYLRGKDVEFLRRGTIKIEHARHVLPRGDEGEAGADRAKPKHGTK